MPTESTTGLYPFDPHGTETTNLVLNELQILKTPGMHDYFFIIPKAAPFFVSSLVVRNHADNSQYTEGVDYVVGHYFVEAMNKTGRAIAGSIRFLRHDISGVVSLTYQTVGGDWGFDDGAILKELSNRAVNPLVRAWGQIDPLPYSFPPISHDQSLSDLIGFEEVVDALENIVTAVEENDTSEFNDHLIATDNPHSVNKVQVGLGEVHNYPVASHTEAETGLRNDRYMTAARTKVAINAIAGAEIDTHIDDKSNPHNVSKVQVGLGSVENYPTASETEARQRTADNRYMTPKNVGEATDQFFEDRLQPYFDGRIVNGTGVTKDQIGLGSVEDYGIATLPQAISATDNDAYMTPLRTFEAVDYYARIPLADHEDDENNPHKVTKAQVGLGNVQDFPVATSSQASAGISNAAYMTPLRVKEAISEIAGGGITVHVNDFNNPHAVTKTQVGLGNVANYGVATEAEAKAGLTNTAYMTPKRTYEAIQDLASGTVGGHLADFSNPHNVTKTQIGLGNVENYETATDTESRQGVLTDRYMTPKGTHAAIDEVVTSVVDSHVSDTSNPHNVTKAQVGLSNIQDFGLADKTIAETGTSNGHYMTPLRVKEAVDKQARGPLDTHKTDTSNPHNVTKLQVGLSNVQNLGLADKITAETGTSNGHYMTPLRVKEAVDKQARGPLDTHKTDTSNPHNVTKTQIGLGNVANLPVAAASDAITGTSNSHYMTPLRVKEAIEELADPLLTAHKDDETNPHNVTKLQVGLGNVENYAIATKTMAEAGTSNTSYMTPLRVKEAIDTLAANDISEHLTDFSNPHNVTPTQIGAATTADIVAINNRFNDYLPAEDKAMDTFKFAGLNEEEYANAVLSRTAANSEKLGGKTYGEIIIDLSDDFTALTTTQSLVDTLEAEFNTAYLNLTPAL